MGLFKKILNLSDFWKSEQSVIIEEPRKDLFLDPEVKKEEKFDLFKSQKMKLPKSIYHHGPKGKYIVTFHSKKYGKRIHAGYASTVEEAIVLRDKFILDNIDDVLQGYLPRGIGFGQTNNYVAYFDFKKMRQHIGSFKKLEDAIEARSNYIKSLI